MTMLDIALGSPDSSPPSPWRVRVRGANRD